MIFTLSGPSCVGKTTISNILIQELPNLRESISYTTRKPREGEVNGAHYHFIEAREFFFRNVQDEFIEYAKVHGNFYGTSKNDLHEYLDEEKDVIAVLDIDGAMNIKEYFGDNSRSIFLLPHSMDILKERLTQRVSSDIDIDIDIRMKNAENEIKCSHWFDYSLKNVDLIECIETLKFIIRRKIKN